MQIQIDSREKARAVTRIVKYFDKNGIGYFVSKLYVADYMSYDNPRLVIDRKQSLGEICANLSDVPKKNKDGTIKRDPNGIPLTERRRFINELIKAKQAGISVIVLCEHGGSIKTLEDVRHWVNPRLNESPLAISGERLYKLMRTLELSDRYDVRFMFCDKRNTGKRIVELLSGGGYDKSV